MAGNANSGGPRAGAPGRAYPNRSDMNAHQAVETVKGQQYGMATQQAQAQKVVPLPNSPAGIAPQAPAQPAAQPGPQPGAAPFDRPTDQPDEPVTTGLPLGAGAGAGILGLSAPADPNVTALHAIYQQYPNNDLLRMIELVQQAHQ